MTKEEGIQSYRGYINRIGWCLVIFLGLINALGSFGIVMGELLTEWLPSDIAAAISGIIDTLFYLAYFLVPGILFYAMSRHHAAQPIRCTVRVPKATPLIILAGVAVVQTAGILNQWFCTAIGYYLPADDMLTYTDTPTAIVSYMTVALAPAFAEEFLFRGVIFGNLRPFGRTQAVLISAMLFGLMHENVAQIFYAPTVGVVLALVYEYTGSIWCSVFIHLFNHQYSVLQSVLYSRFTEVPANVILYALHAVIILAGGISMLLLLTKRRDWDKQVRDDRSIWGHTDEGLLRIKQPLDLPTALRQCTAPGMLVFLILAVLSTIFTVLMVWGGGLLS